MLAFCHEGCATDVFSDFDPKESHGLVANKSHQRSDPDSPQTFNRRGHDKSRKGVIADENPADEDSGNDDDSREIFHASISVCEPVGGLLLNEYKRDPEWNGDAGITKVMDGVCQ